MYSAKRSIPYGQRLPIRGFPLLPRSNRTAAAAFPLHVPDAVGAALRTRSFLVLALLDGVGVLVPAHHATKVFGGRSHDVLRSRPSLPCRDGLSHNEAEYATPEDITAGANVLLNAVLKLDAA